jgi:uncharacterized protein (TIGR03083 family)
MEKAQYLDALETNTQGMLAVGREGLSAAVPTCHGWTVGHVLAHVGRAYNVFGEMIRNRSQQPPLPRPNEHSFDPRDPGIIPWLEESFSRYYDTMRSTDMDEPVWSWSGDNRAGFWLRLQAHEAAIHRTDAQSAHGEAEPIAGELAADAINGMLDWFLPHHRSFSLFPSRGERYLFRRTDGSDTWLLDFGGNGVEVHREPGEADVTVEAPGSDILLFLWNRLPPARLSPSGDRRLLERYRDLAPGM